MADREKVEKLAKALVGLGSLHVARELFNQLEAPVVVGDIDCAINTAQRRIKMLRTEAGL